MFPMGPGFFIFFQNENVAPLVVSEPGKISDDEEIIELMRIIFSFLENGEPK